MATLKNWKRVPVTGGGTCLVGEIYEDDRFPNGSFIRTSKLKLLSYMEKYAITESGTKYQLD